jgi:RNA polymerase sigma factor (sigma-70 family)
VPALLRAKITADDLLQVGMESVVKNFGMYEPERGSVSTFVVHYFSNAIRWHVMNESRRYHIKDADDAQKRSGREIALDPEMLEIAAQRYSDQQGPPRPDAAVMRRDTKARVKRIMETHLTEKERDILRRKFGFVDDAESFRELGDSYGISKQAIEQVLRRAMVKLRIALEGEGVLRLEDLV